MSADLKWPAGVTPPPEFQTAVDFARDDEGHLFVTGRAGTGKSTLLRACASMITRGGGRAGADGLAAVNVGGQTIHSFFGFPPRLIRSDDIRRSRNGRLMRKLKAHHHRRGVDGALRPDVGHRPVAAHQPRAPARSLRRRAPASVRRSAPVAAGGAGRGGRRAPRKRARRAVLLPGAGSDGRRRRIRSSSSSTCSARATRRCCACSIACATARRPRRISRSSTSARTPSARSARATPTSSSRRPTPPPSASTWPTSRRCPAT